MNVLIVIGATASLCLFLIALYGIVCLLDRIPAIHRALDSWMPEGWQR
jgi:hypothetical protein